MKFINKVRAVLLIGLLAACTAPQPATTTQVYPKDLAQPFLSFEHDLGTDRALEQSWLSSIWGKIKGPVVPVSLLRPTALAVNFKGDVYVVDADAGRILCFHYVAGEFQDVATFGSKILTAPLGIALSNGIIYVSDSAAGVLQRFDLNLHYLGALEVKGLQRPGQIKVNPVTGELVVIDLDRHLLLVINDQGTITHELQSLGSRSSLLQAPVACDFTTTGQLLVLDGLARRVERFDEHYKYQSGFGGYDRVPGAFAFPRGLAVAPDGFIFVSDAILNVIQIFDAQGTLLYYWGRAGQADGEFMLPTALAFDAVGNLYVADQYNNRVQVFHYIEQGQ